MQPISIDFLFRNLIASLMMPPLLWIFIAGLALVFIRKKLRLQRVLIGICLLMIWVTSTTAFANWFVDFSGNWMNWPMAINLSNPKVLQEIKNQVKPSAIVVLGGGKVKGVLHRSDLMLEDLSKEALQRVRYAALLSKYTHLPILVTGGAPESSSKYPTAEAQLMAKVLQDELNTKVTWIEDQSKTTQENAQFSSNVLQKAHIKHIYLVTNFWHLPRAKRIFEKYGFEVSPAPMGFEFRNEFDLNELSFLDFLPTPSGLQRVREIWHEAIGGIWYQFRYKS